MKDKNRPGALEESILTAMKALDNQISREMQRSPSQRELHGVQKWQPYQTRIENTCAFILDNFGEEVVGLDSLIVLSQTYVKALKLIAEDLGEDGLGKVRSGYVLEAMRAILHDAQSVIDDMADRHELV